MSKIDGRFSENEDDPDVPESSGDEWNSSMELEKKRNNRRASQRLSKKPRVTHAESSDSDIDDPKPKSRNGVNKRQKISSAPKTTSTKRGPLLGSRIIATDFVNGSFLILKRDAQSGDPTKHPCIWRIDGKALLQKYEPFEENGVIRHRNTSIYTGWSALDKDLYAPVVVKVHWHSSQQMIVEMNWEKLKKELNMDSD